MAGVNQLLAQFLEVVDLAVEDDPDSSIFIGHGLVSRGREVNDRKPAMDQRNKKLRFLQGKHLLSGIIGPAMTDGMPTLDSNGAVRNFTIDSAHTPAN